MTITVTGGALSDITADIHVVMIPSGSTRLTGDGVAADRATGGAATKMLSHVLFTGKTGEVAVLPATGRSKAKRIVLLGLGERSKFTSDTLRTQMGNLSRRLRDIGGGSVAISLDALDGVEPEQAGEAIAEGFVLGLYRFDKHHTRAADRPTNSVGEISVIAGAARRVAAVRRGVESGSIMAEAQNFARDLGNEPANLMTPTIMAARAQQLAASAGLECTIIERAEAERLKMGSYLSVSNGSVQPPKFIVLNYRGGGPRGRTIALVGKGITFDTGGISLKPPADMDAMKGDMSGAAVVIGAIGAIARLQLPVNVMAVAPCTENMPSGSATKPGDVVYAMDGQSIEVINTDAEGRLVLADGIAYAKAQGATTVIDVATLTGAVRVALGTVRFGIFCNNDRLMAEIEHAGEAAGEKMWRLPLDDEYGELIKSPVADMKNTGGAPAGSITAAKFIQNFVGDTPWAHLDIAAIDTTATEAGVNPRGNTGRPLRTLVHFVAGRAK
ncbi:MAG: leucyl aminopeptidase [Dehalococcoidia bacterium]|nr:leucyl aminopeptidase [Dehalococcoidia bacterium]